MEQLLEAFEQESTARLRQAGASLLERARQHPSETADELLAGCGLEGPTNTVLAEVVIAARADLLGTMSVD